MIDTTRRQFIRATAGGVVAGAALGTAGANEHVEIDAEYEVWALDQGEDLNKIHIYQPWDDGDDGLPKDAGPPEDAGDNGPPEDAGENGPPEDAGDEHPEFVKVDAIPLNPHDVETPHMIAFTENGEYAVTANTGSGDIAIIDAENRDVVDVVDTGPGSHFASFYSEDEDNRLYYTGKSEPGEEDTAEEDDNGDENDNAEEDADEDNDYPEYIHVDVIGDGEIKRVDADFEQEAFEIDEEIDVIDAGPVDDRRDEFEPRVPEEDDDEFLSPICHDYTGDDYSYHTLGPSYNNAGLVVVDHGAFEVERAFPPAEVPTNCGTLTHPDDDTLYLTAGLPSTPEEDEEGLGEWYVFDTHEHLPIDNDGETVEEDDIDPDEIARDSRGIDAHGLWFVGDEDDRQAWVLNRETNDGIVLDADNYEGEDAIEVEIDEFGPGDGDEPEDSDAPDIMWGAPDTDYLFVSTRGPNPLSGDPHASTGVNAGFAIMDTEAQERVTQIRPEGYTPASDFHGIGVRETTDD